MSRFSWLKRLSKFNRGQITLLIAALALGLGATSPWYRFPPQVADTFGIHPLWTSLGRGIAGLLSLCGFAYALRLGVDRTPRFPFWSGLIAILLFPYLLNTWSPALILIAKSYYGQSTQVTTHIEDTFPEVQAQWQQGVSLNISPLTTSALPLSIKDSRFFQISAWDQVVEGLGYNNAFWELIGLGWLVTLIGLVIALLGIYLGAIDDSKKNFYIDINKLLPGIGLGLGCLIISILWPHFLNYQLNTMLAKGEYRSLLTGSQTLAFLYPPFTQDADFLKRLAEGYFYSGNPDPALTAFAKGTERYELGDLVGAAEQFQQALAIDPHRVLVRDYLATTLLNQGVRDFNNALPAAAIQYFEKVLEIFPNHLEALYDLMVATAVNSQFDRSAQVAKQILSIEPYFQIPSVALLGRAYLHLSWSDYHDGDINQAWQQYRKSVDKRAWKE